MKANVEALLETRKMVTEKLSELGFEIIPSQANFLWVKPLELSAKRLFEKLKEKKIVVRYFPDSKRTEEYLRITIGTAPEMLTFLDAVKAIFDGE